MLSFCRVDPFSKKDWYDVKAPSTFTTRNVGKTLVTRTAGTKVSQLLWVAYGTRSACAVVIG